VDNKKRGCCNSEIFRWQQSLYFLSKIIPVRQYLFS
jgi:hypothetical protein